MAAPYLLERTDSPVDARPIIDFVLAAAAASAGVGTYRQRLRLRRDRSAVAAAAIESQPVALRLPGVSVGSIVLSEEPGIDGGDIVDVFELDSRFALLLVADVCGRGAQAAAQTAFIRYTIRTLALESEFDPAVVLAKFNAIYFRTVKDDEAFVVLILGIIDSQTGDLRYASAGHEPAFIRRGNGRLSLLEPTGPIIGAAPFSAYGSDVLQLAPGDVVVWTTDGMTESRDRQHRLLGTDGLAAWIGAAPGDARAVAGSLVTALGERSGDTKRDDVAVLVVGYNTEAARHRPASGPAFPAISRPAFARKRRQLG
jgi:sigma-B regulation protein RsbU (phosphoserine phosphatase)